MSRFSFIQTIPSRLTEPFTKFRSVILFLSAVMTFLSWATYEPEDSSLVVNIIMGILVLLYLSTVACSYFALLPVLARRIRSGNRQFHVHAQTERKASTRLYVALYPVFLLTSTILVGVGLLMLSDHIILALFPEMEEVLTSEQETLSLWKAIGLAGFSTNEEIWRFSFITLLLLLAKKAFPARWTAVSFQWVVVAIGVLISSICFGTFHIANYSTGVLPTFLATGISGIIFACITLFTRRILLAMLVHFCFNLIAMTRVDIPTEAYVLSYIGLAIFSFSFYKLFRHVYRNLNASVVPPEEQLVSVSARSVDVGKDINNSF